jgi:RNase P subunit RPR2
MGGTILDFRLFPIFKGLFSKWHCPKCNEILTRKQVKYQQVFKGHYTEYWFRCLNCGNKDGVMTVRERINEIICGENHD